MGEPARTSLRQKKRKKAYEKPQLRPIKFDAGEVLGVGCKTTVSSGSGFTPCIAGCSQGGS